MPQTPFVIESNVDTRSELWASLSDQRLQFSEAVVGIPDAFARATSALVHVDLPTENAVFLEVAFSLNGSGKLVQPDDPTAGPKACDGSVASCPGTRPPPDPAAVDKSLFMFARNADVLEGAAPLGFYASEAAAAAGLQSTSPPARRIYWLMQVKAAWTCTPGGVLTPLSTPSLVGWWLTIPVKNPTDS